MYFYIIIKIIIIIIISCLNIRTSSNFVNDTESSSVTGQNTTCRRRWIVKVSSVYNYIPLGLLIRMNFFYTLVLVVASIVDHGMNRSMRKGVGMS